MKNNKYINFLLHPPVWFSMLCFILTFIFAPVSILSFTLFNWHIALASIVSAIAAILLFYSVYLVVKFTRKAKQQIKVTAQKNKLTNRIINDEDFRTLIFASWAFIVNLTYSAYQAMLGILNLSIWFGSLAAYYLVLSIMKLALILRFRKLSKMPKFDSIKNTLQQLKIYKICGILFILLTLALTVPITLMVIENKVIEHPGLMIYVTATFTFYKLILAIVRVVKARKNGNYSIQCFKNIALAEALVALMSLQTALIYTFGNGENMMIMNVLTGFFVVAFIVSMGVFLIIRAKQKFKELNNIKN